MRSIAIPAVEQEGYRALVRRRKQIAEGLGKVKQKIKRLLLTSGIEEQQSIQKWSVAAFADLTTLDVPTQHHMALASVVREYLLHTAICAATARGGPGSGQSGRNA